MFLSHSEAGEEAVYRRVHVYSQVQLEESYRANGHVHYYHYVRPFAPFCNMIVCLCPLLLTYGTSFRICHASNFLLDGPFL